jgi:hypothetical protein
MAWPSHFWVFQDKAEPSIVTHTCIPSYLEGGDREDCGLRPDWAKSYRDPILTNKLVVFAHAGNPNY